MGLTELLYSSLFSFLREQREEPSHVNHLRMHPPRGFRAPKTREEKPLGVLAPLGVWLLDRFSRNENTGIPDFACGQLACSLSIKG